MKIHDVKQGTEEWLRLRMGIPTASQFSRIITPKTRKLSSSHQRYLHELLAERILGRPVNDASTDFMQRGLSLENDAVKAYEFEREVETVAVGFITHDSGRWGCSPDRLVGNDGMLETKSHGAPAHIAALLGHMDEEHFAQTQGQLWVAEREWCDLSYYNPELPRRVVRVYRDDTFILDLEQLVTAFCELLDIQHAKIVGLMGGSTSRGSDTERKEPAAAFGGAR